MQGDDPTASHSPTQDHLAAMYHSAPAPSRRATVPTGGPLSPAYGLQGHAAAGPLHTSADADADGDTSLALEKARLDQQLQSLTLLGGYAGASPTPLSRELDGALLHSATLSQASLAAAELAAAATARAVSPSRPTTPVASMALDTFILDDDMVLQCDDPDNLHRLLHGAGGPAFRLPPVNEWFAGTLGMSGDGSFAVIHSDDPSERLHLGAKKVLLYSNLATNDGVAITLKPQGRSDSASPGSSSGGAGGGYMHASQADPGGSEMASLVFLRFRSIDSTATLLSFTKNRKEEQMRQRRRALEYGTWGEAVEQPAPQPSVGEGGGGYTHWPPSAAPAPSGPRSEVGSEPTQHTLPVHPGEFDRHERAALADVSNHAGLQDGGFGATPSPSPSRSPRVGCCVPPAPCAALCAPPVAARELRGESHSPPVQWQQQQQQPQHCLPPCQQVVSPCGLDVRPTLKTPQKPLSSAMQAYYARQVAHTTCSPKHVPWPQGSGGGSGCGGAGRPRRSFHKELQSYERYRPVEEDEMDYRAVREAEVQQAAAAGRHRVSSGRSSGKKRAGRPVQPQPYQPPLF